MRSHGPLVCKPAAQLALGLTVSVILAGCNGGIYRPVTNGIPPADTVTFQSASTQGWLQQYGTGFVLPGQQENLHGGDTVYGVATDPQGNVIVLDETFGSFPGFSNPNHLPEFAVVKFDSSGNRLWIQQLGSGAGDFPYAIATDAQGNIVIGGATQGAFPTFANPAGVEESIVIKLNSSGQMVWTQQFPSTSPSQVTGLAVDAQGNVIVGGEELSTGYSGANTQGGYIAKLEGATGTTLWNQNNNAQDMDYGVTSVAVDSQGNVLALGGFPGAGSKASTIYMATKLNGATGTTIWQQLPVTLSAQGVQNLIYTQVALDTQGNLLLGGLDDSTGYSRCAIAKLANANGATQWQQEFGAAEFCIPGTVATDTTGNVLMSGNIEHPFFAATTHQDDVFLAKLNANGQGVWVQQFGTGKELPTGTSSASALVFVATDSQNHADVAGSTMGAFPGFTNPNGAGELFVTQFGP